MTGQRVCVVRFGAYTVGLHGAYTRQIHSLTDLRRAPRTPSTLLGLFAVRSQVIPIVALEPLLGLPVPKHEFAVQLEFEGRSFGIGIDAALGFVAFEAATPAFEPFLESVCQDAIYFNQQVVPLLSLSKILEQLSLTFTPQSSPLVVAAPATTLRVLS